MANQIIPHRYNGKQIEQLSEDGIIGGRLIPKGYCNATKLCKAAGKKSNDYLRLKRSNAYIKALSLDTGINVSNLVIELRGEIIEVKRVKNWKAALGQVLAYGYFYPSHQKRIHLFGKAHSVSVKHISSICQQYRVRVTWDT
jgi:hypothetical protein